MSFPLPVELRRTIAAIAVDVPAAAIAERAAAISAAYRQGHATHTTIASPADVAAYLTARLPATYAAARAAMGAARDLLPRFAPASLLDLGAGPGTASFAALDAWPSIARATLLDANQPFLAAARHLGNASAHAALRDTTLRRADLVTALDGMERADLAVMSYALVELPETMLADLARRAFGLTEGLLVLVEPGTPEGFRRILLCRDALIAAGARIVAPCPHALPCPMRTPAWCHFRERLPRTREHLRAKGATVPFEDEPYSYLAAARTPGEPVRARFVDHMRVSKVEARGLACMAGGDLADIAAPRRDRDAYARLRRMDWGDAIGLPDGPTSAVEE